MLFVSSTICGILGLKRRDVLFLSEPLLNFKMYMFYCGFQLTCKDSFQNIHSRGVLIGFIEIGNPSSYFDLLLPVKMDAWAPG